MHHSVNARILEFLESVLIRNPDLRPTIDHLERMFDTLLGIYTLDDKDLGLVKSNSIDSKF